MTKIFQIDRLFPNNHLRPQDIKVIESIIDSITANDNLDIRFIAKKNYLSTASISRLVKRAGFANFKEFIFFLSSRYKNQPLKTYGNLPYVHCNVGTEVVANFFQKIKLEKRTYLFGEGFCKILVNYTYRKLLLKRIYGVDLDGVEISIASDQLPHTLITFSQSGENKNGLIKIAGCKKDGGNIITITATPHSTYANIGDLAFVVDSGSGVPDPENTNLNYFYGNTINLIENIVNQHL
ncbi:MurR/RpiR family transcriptional regulator [Lactobacillus helsingborgensis]|uniref:MurR/RpiR family transcriptional regulator n=1 Tax=Lactobacillus helsingborgensis TaxID=1218494 RepID=UPI001CC7498D|nr:MurR/RpiR family transcriptional regulator [Lactobacillus helsingborgensis]